MKTFYVRMLQGEILDRDLQEVFDDECDKWHAGEAKTDLATFLGMPKAEFNKVAVDPAYLMTLRDKASLTAQELIAILQSLPPEAKVRYDSCCDLYASNVEFDEDLQYIVLNR